MKRRLLNLLTALSLLLCVAAVADRIMRLRAQRGEHDVTYRTEPADKPTSDHAAAADTWAGFGGLRYGHTTRRVAYDSSVTTCTSAWCRIGFWPRSRRHSRPSARGGGGAARGATTPVGALPAGTT
jgi:hypothetical protein